MARDFVPGIDVTSLLAEAIGLDPKVMPIKSITIRSPVGDAVTADVELYVERKQFGAITEVLRRYRVEPAPTPE